MCDTLLPDDYRQCYDHSPFAFCVVKVARGSAGEASGLRFSYVNAACAAMLGLTQEETLGEAFGSDALCLRVCDETARTGENRSFQIIRMGRELCAQCVRVDADLCACQWMDVTFLGHAELESVTDNALLGKCRANVTRNRVDHYIGGENLLFNRQAQTYTQVIQSISELCAGPFPAEQLRQSLLPDTVRRRLAQGENRFEVEYQRRMLDQSIHWVKTVLRVYTDPDTSDTLCFLSTYDINQQKMAQFAFDMVVRQTYDFVGVINCLTGGYVSLVRVKGRAYLPPQRHENYEAVTLEYASRLRELFDSEEDYDLAVHVASLENLNGELQKRGRLDVTFKIWNETRNVLNSYRFSFAYLDARQTQILVCRADITAAVSEEQRQQMLLRSALTQARQASVAKTEFLSRMSHEIRTPMNAIIGMSALAAQCVNDPKQVADCISKVGISARFLLSLINDILDMSRIESGKINIKNEKIPFEEFIGGINAICYEQATQKGVDYDAVVATFTEDCYMGDAMKLQQVLVNIIANAVKFTPKGGKVQFIVQQEREADGKAWMKFIVNDTGIGIHEEFLPKLFEPFEQENQGVSSLYGGTGLGLAICKNLIELMGGRITVNSIAGVGSEFTVEVALGICEEKPTRTASLMSIPLNQLSALVVDDDILICENTRAILLDMGLKAEWADSGRKAMDQVRRRFTENKNYDIVLIDWKMPEMDGIETARQIRAIVGPDVTIIIITAYDWASIEAEARAAGVNMLISKPLFKTSLMSAFRRIYSERKQSVPPEPTEYDFTGKRALLVEDHLLNVEVARRLLMAKNMEVEVAENGLAALEAFAAAPLGHFDVILMDIRMPVMDGLTAARSIRQMKKKTSQSIPIIAMSANAFDEDVEKSRLAGMTAHLAKPIEPEVLYATLQQHLSMRREDVSIP